MLEQAIDIASVVEPWAADDGEFGYAIAMNDTYFVASAPFWDVRIDENNWFDEVGEVFVFPLSEVVVSTDRFAESDFSLAGFSLFPNPAAHALTVELNASTREGSTVKVFNVLGRQVLVSTIPVGTRSYTASIDKLPEGLYGVQVCGKISGCSTSTFIKLDP